MRHLIAILLVFGVILGVVYGVLNTPIVTEYYAPRFINTQIKNLHLESFQVQRQTIRFPDTLEMYGVSGDVIREGQTYAFSAAKVTLYDLKKFLENRQQLKFLLEGLNVDREGDHLKNVKLKMFLSWDQMSINGIEGIFHGDALEILPYQTGELTGRVRGNGDRIEIFEFATNSYGGQAKGQLQLQLRPTCQYVLWLEYQKLQAALLKSTGNHLFAQIDGTLDGTLRVVGGLRAIELLSVNFFLPAGSVLKSSLLQKMIGPIEDLNTKAQVEALLLSRDTFPIDSASFMIKNVPNNRVMMDFDINNKAEQLRLKGSQEFRFDPALKSIFHQPKKEPAPNPVP